MLSFYLAASDPDDNFIINNLTGSISVNKNVTRGTYYPIAMVSRYIFLQYDWLIEMQ